MALQKDIYIINIQKPLNLVLKIIGCATILFFTTKHTSAQKILWQIGKAHNSDTEFALAPSGYKDFLEKDFGWENKFYLIGFSDPKKDWPYALPGPEDAWGGSAGGAGNRAAVENILFGIDKLPQSGNFDLVIDLMDMSAEKPPLLKVTVNDSSWEYRLPKGSGDSTLKGQKTQYPGYVIKIPISANVIKKGGNEIKLTSLWGSWLVFKHIRMEGPEGVQIAKPDEAFIRNVKAGDYEINTDGKLAQPLLIDVQYLFKEPVLTAFVDGHKIFEEKIEKGRYIFEAPMPVVQSSKDSHYEIKINNRLVSSGEIRRSPQKMITQAGYVNTLIGTAHSRWMIAPGPWMPFGMVKISPDNQNAGWQGGYDPIFESIGGFSHIHEWTMSGLSMMPVNGPLITKIGDQSHPESGYRSLIDKQSEEAPLGYYKVHLTKYNITAELTATTRCSFQRYTFPKEKASRILIDLATPAEYGYELQDVEITKVSDYRIEGFSKQESPGVWGNDIDQNYTIHFVMDFSQPLSSFGSWIDSSVQKNISKLKIKNTKQAGVYVEFNTIENPVVQVRTGISYVSIKNAEENLEHEIIKPFGWNFNAVRQYNVNTWNKLLGRVKISTSDRSEKIRFYTNMYRALSGRNTYSDVNGEWMDATGNVQKLKDPDALALGCDAFWNTFWNLNQLWNLVTPEWSSRWVRSQLAMYDANGALAKGPAGMKYIPVMVAEHEIEVIAGAYQMGIRNYDVQKAYQAIRKMETTPAWKIGKGLAGNRDLEPFLKYHYVPYDKGRFSNTLEYAYDNWAVAQFAKALGNKKDYQLFSAPASWWKNAIDKESGYAHLRKSDGSWMKKFDPLRSGANEQYVEGNAWQLTYFVPQNVPALISWIGKDRFVDRLKWGFEQSYKWRFNAPAEEYWAFPVDQGNQQSMQFAFLFNYAGKPWLTQKWSRAILDRYYGYGLSNAYLGDEDQGQMSAWFIMTAMGLFQVDGGCSINPTYGIASPLFKKITIDLGNRFGRGKTFIIKANDASRQNMYIQRATLNGKPLNSSIFPASELLKGGELELEMGPNPNENWGSIPTGNQ
ncbi:MAG: GH92 family glycosyl hydrolase [Bacteroidota bacterium]|nr:GH92 family glycosyl hydrolase [Bacteroidota bacterium]